VLTVLYDESGILWYVVIWHILSYVIWTSIGKPWQNMIGKRVAPE
jgi:hypothetical protein